MLNTDAKNPCTCNTLSISKCPSHPDANPAKHWASHPDDLTRGRTAMGQLDVDPVNHPSHYASGKVECIDALEAATQNLTGLEAVCTANAIKYLWRWKAKGGKQDLEKARWYINRLLGES